MLDELALPQSVKPVNSVGSSYFAFLHRLHSPPLHTFGPGRALFEFMRFTTTRQFDSPELRSIQREIERETWHTSMPLTVQQFDEENGVLCDQRNHHSLRILVVLQTRKLLPDVVRLGFSTFLSADLTVH